MSKPHWLPGPARDWSPDSVVVFDTETSQAKDSADIVMRAKCWDYVHVLRHGIHATLPRRRINGGEHMGQLVHAISDIADRCGETHVFAHNLGFDLAVSALPYGLATLGWYLDGCNLTGESTWWAFRRDGVKLVLCDSWSWLRDELGEVAKDLRKRKLPLPSDDDPLDQWHRRCRRDCEILEAAILTLMDWWDENHMGRWAITGAGCGFAAARKVMGQKAIVVGPEPGRTEMERECIHSGKRQLYRAGRFIKGYTADYDFSAAYTRAAAHLPLPMASNGRLGKNDLVARAEPVPGYDVIADVTVTTDTPCVPARVDGETCEPVGTFRTTLCGPEIRYALALGASVTLHGGWRYRMGYKLADWAGWCLALRYARHDEAPAVVSRAAKGWGRSVIGRFGGRTSRVVLDRDAAAEGWSLTTGADLDTGRSMDVLTIGGREITYERDAEPDNAFPAVLAFVESYVRVALDQMIRRRPPGHVLAVNTDGWLEHRAIRSTEWVMPDVPWPHVIVRKGLWAETVLLGPSHLSAKGERRLAGIPRGADEVGHNAFTWHDWPSLRWQLERSTLGVYRRPLHEAEVAGPYCRRWLLANGETVPLATDVGMQGNNVVVPWSLTPGRREGDTLADEQDGMLASAVDDTTGIPAMTQPPYRPELGRKPRIG